MEKKVLLLEQSKRLLIGLGLFTLIELGVIFLLKDNPAAMPASDLLNVLINLTTTLLLWQTARYAKLVLGRIAKSWGILCLAQLLFTMGDLLWTVYELILQSSPYPSIADIFYILYYPIFFIGILFLSQKPDSKIKRINNWLDAGIVFIVINLFIGVYIFPQIMESAVGEPFLVKFLSLAYPAGDVILFSAILILIYNRDEEKFEIPILFIMLSVLIQVASDIIYSFQSLQDAYISGGWLDSGWILGYLFMGIAAYTHMRDLDRQESVSVPDQQSILKRQLKKTLRDTLPILSILLAFLLFFRVFAADSSAQVRHIIGGIGLLFSLVSARQFLTLWENAQLNRNLRTTLDLAQTQAANLQKINADLQVEIRERKKAEDQLAFDALHDALTKLPNRVLLTDRLQHAIDYSKRHSDYSFSVFFIDIDHFKNVNDSMGHSIGDQLLVLFAERVMKCLRKSDTLARLGGDEFAVLLEINSEKTDPKSIAERIQEILRPPYQLGGKDFFVSASFGIVEDTSDYKDADSILQDADIAMYRAKALGKARYELFTASLRTEALSRLELESQLQHAVGKKELFLNYQPIFSLGTQKLIGFEALLRWKHPQRGTLLPADFLLIAESSGLIIKIGQWVITEACRQMKEWQKKIPGSENLVMNINISGHQFAHPDFVETLDQITRQSGLKPANICLEITETVLIENQEQSRAVFKALHAMGYEIQIDDFGTGYSSLGYLLNFHVDTIKIDKSFIQSIGKGENGLNLVKTIVDMAQNLGIEIIAEGIETEKQLSDLKSIDCQYGQGYLLSRPVAPQEIERLLQSTKE